MGISRLLISNVHWYPSEVIETNPSAFVIEKEVPAEVVISPEQTGAGPSGQLVADPSVHILIESIYYS